MRWHLSVRAQLILSSLLLLLVVSFAFTAVSLRLTQRWVEEDLRERAITFAREVAATIGDRREFESPEVLRRQIGRLMEARANVRNLDFIALGEGWPRVLATSDPAWRSPLNRAQRDRLLRGQVLARLVERGGERHWEVLAPIVLEGTVAGAVAAEFSLAQADRQASRVRRAALAITGASVLVTVLLMGVMVRWLIARPIRQILDAIERVEAGDLAAGVAVSRRDEFGRLAAHFNQMLERLRGARQEQEERVRRATAELAERYAEVRRLNELLFQAQRRLRRAERLALMGRTVGMVAHEIGTPLHSVAGHLELLRQELPSEVLRGSPERRLAIVQSQLVRVTETIEQLLRQTRLPRAEAARVDLNALLGEVLTLLSPGMTAAGVQLATAFAPALAPVSGDAAQLQQAFLNVLVNALDVLPPGGRLVVETGTERRDGREWAWVRVRDDGPGISPEHLKRIFEPFFTTKEPGRGAGLGLFITQQVVRDHHGEIEVESTEGRGTTFTLAFPAAETDR